VGDEDGVSGHDLADAPSVDGIPMGHAVRACGSSAAAAPVLARHEAHDRDTGGRCDLVC
jgi:hypothetical protein